MKASPEKLSVISLSTDGLNQKCIQIASTLAATTSEGMTVSKASLMEPLQPSFPHTLNQVDRLSKNLQSSSITDKNQAAPSPSPYILDAAKKRAQYGFPNRTVPSIPQPPHKNTSRKRAVKEKAVRKKGSPLINSTMNSSSLSINEGPSYERKKQRAKDARVKLNEALERMSIAINMAGTQSKQRAQLHSQWGSRLEISPQSRLRESAGNHSTIKVMEDVVKAAESAKKWDRPSFVSTAATMIQGLNSQCEALMKEILQMRKEQLLSEKERKETRDSECSDKKRRRECANVSDSGSFDEKDDFEGIQKRRKQMQDTMNDKSIVDLTNIMKSNRAAVTIGSFLDPRSICRCFIVSSTWRRCLTPMRNFSIWTNLCTLRFGSTCTREWLNRYECVENDCFLSVGSNEVFRKERSLMGIYKEMHLSNVKPKCHYEGNISLGNGNIQNVSCAWASLVERSNGETSRSILCNKDGKIQYASLPVVEIRFLIQNIGISNGAIHVPEQIISVDTSTKRRGGEMFEVTFDSRFTKKILRSDGTPLPVLPANNTHSGVRDLFRLELFESAIICAFIHCKECPTSNKFLLRANYSKVLVNVNGTTLPLVVPFTTKK